MIRNFPPIHLYILPILFFILGGAIFVWTGWENVTWAIFGVGFVATLHLILSDVLEKIRELWFEKTSTYQALAKVPVELRNYEPNDDAPDYVKVTVDQTAVVGNQLSLLHTKLPASPQLMNIIAHASLNGVPFTIRQWAGEGKYMSDPEWRELKDALLSMNFLRLKNPKDVHQGFEWTELGIQLLEQYATTSVLSDRREYA